MKRIAAILAVALGSLTQTAWGVDLFVPFSTGSTGCGVSISPGHISSGCPPQTCQPRPYPYPGSTYFGARRYFRSGYGGFYGYNYGYGYPYYGNQYYGNPYGSPYGGYTQPYYNPYRRMPNYSYYLAYAPTYSEIDSSASSIQFLSTSTRFAPALDEEEQNAEDVRVATQISELKTQTNPEVLVRYFQDPNGEVRQAAVQALTARGAAAIPVLLDSLESREPLVRTTALETLGRMGPTAEPQVAHVIKALDDRDSNVRREAAWALGRMGAQGEAAIATLIQMLGDESDDVREQAIDTLSLQGEPAVQPLVAALSNSRTSIRNGAGRALGDIGKPAIDRLIPLLDDENTSTRFLAAYALGEIGPPAQAANKRLAALARDADYDVRYYAQTALNKINR